jgi:hypothetical protein
MREFDAISEKYCQAGVSLDNVEYAITAVKFGSNPDQIIENLKVGYKSLNDEQANALLRDLFIANKIEIKRKKRLVFALGLFYFLVGLVCVYYLLHILIFGGVLHRPLFVILVAIAGVSAGLFYFLKSFKTNSENVNLI